MVAITHDRLEISTGKGVSVFPLDEIDRVEKRGRGSVALIDTHGQERLIPPYLDRSEELFSRLSAVAEENRLALSYSSDDQLAKNANLELV